MTEVPLLALLFTVAAVSFALGAHLAKHRERFRRIWRDWKVGRKGQRTLRKMGRREAWALMKAGALLLLAAALVISAVLGRDGA